MALLLRACITVRQGARHPIKGGSAGNTARLSNKPQIESHRPPGRFILEDMTLDPETKARIEAEEAYRAQVRAAHAPRRSWGIGAFLTFMVPGLGLAYLGQGWLTVAYIAIAVMLALAIPPYLAWALVFLFGLLHYTYAYHQLYPTEHALTRSLTVLVGGLVIVWIVLATQA